MTGDVDKRPLLSAKDEITLHLNGTEVVALSTAAADWSQRIGKEVEKRPPTDEERMILAALTAVGMRILTEVEIARDIKAAPKKNFGEYVH